ncbi:hypothetical protein FDA94_10070 [Herbidospora galbida]|uniref:Uncharacterized protein n=1 Tax=Herbidospora galbida TaxID=2575442 RepID=A0A4U3MIW9_9ACTN|nr:hypothetical protein [Herbidospora galbida]TKK89271.1 hypothetical protein FDA94_10070 [Herbidospora galbida]
MADQWDLLREAGLGSGFSGTWVECGNPEKVAAVLGADPGSRHDCDLATAMAHYRPMSLTERVWIGRHAEGWVHVLTISGPPLETGNLTASGLRFLHFTTRDSGVDPLVHGDGATTGTLDRRPGFGDLLVPEPGSWIEPHMARITLPEMPEISRWGSMTEPEGLPRYWLEVHLRLIVAVTGRAVDQEWVGDTRALYTIPLAAP